MISALQAFLVEAAKEKGSKTVDLGGRLAGHPFVIRGLSLEEMQDARKKAIVTTASGVEMKDDIEATRQIIIAGCVEPDFKDSDFAHSVGCVTPSQVVNKVLLGGEAARLAREITRASGLPDDINKAIEEAKN